MFDLSIYSVVLVAHVTAATVLIGSSLVVPLIRRSVLGAGSTTELLMWLGLGHRAERMNPVSAFLVLGTGVYLGSAGWWGQGWFYVAVALWVLNAVLAAGVVRRAESALTAAARASHGPVTADVDALRRSAAWVMASSVILASDLTMLYVMFIKPSVAESLLVVGVVAAAIAGGSLARNGRGRIRIAGNGAPPSPARA